MHFELRWYADGASNLLIEVWDSSASALTLVYFEKSGRKTQVLLYSIILWNCKYVTICSVFILYEIKMEIKKTKTFFCQIENFWSGIGIKTYNFSPKIGWLRALTQDRGFCCCYPYELILPRSNTWERWKSNSSTSEDKWRYLVC